MNYRSMNSNPFEQEDDDDESDGLLKVAPELNAGQYRKRYVRFAIFTTTECIIISSSVKNLALAFEMAAKSQEESIPFRKPPSESQSTSSSIGT